MGKKIGILTIVLLIIIFGIFAFKWVKHRLEFVVSDAVFVEIDNLTDLSFKRVAGKIEKVYVKEGEAVKKGQALVKLDDTDYRLKLEKIQKEINSLQEKKKSLSIKKERIKQEVNINLKITALKKEELQKQKEYVKEKISSIQAQIENTEKDIKRFKPLVERQLAPRKRLDDLFTKLQTLKAEKKALQAKLKQIDVNLKIVEENIKLTKAKKLQIKELEKNIFSLTEKIQSLEKDREDIKNLIKYTDIKSPFDGKVAKIYREESEVVSSGMPVVAVVPDKGFYIKVLLEETKLEGVKEGNRAFIKIDAYPDEGFEGVVERIMPVAAAKFALVPRDITAGEFTKVAQRIPVRIKITKGNIKLLRVGMGAEVEIERK